MDLNRLLAAAAAQGQQPVGANSGLSSHGFPMSTGVPYLPPMSAAQLPALPSMQPSLQQQVASLLAARQFAGGAGFDLSTTNQMGTPSYAHPSAYPMMYGTSPMQGVPTLGQLAPEQLLAMLSGLSNQQFNSKPTADANANAVVAQQLLNVLSPTVLQLLNMLASANNSSYGTMPPPQPSLPAPEPLPANTKMTEKDLAELILSLAPAKTVADSLPASKQALVSPLVAGVPPPPPPPPLPPPPPPPSSSALPRPLRPLATKMDLEETGAVQFLNSKGVDATGPLQQAHFYTDLCTRELVTREQAISQYNVYKPGSSKKTRFRCDYLHKVPWESEPVGFCNVRYRTALSVHSGGKCQILGGKSRIGLNSKMVVPRKRRRIITSENGSMNTAEDTLDTEHSKQFRDHAHDR